jgi:pimeloyl-ACP methyl ester carboxylesterase
MAQLEQVRTPVLDIAYEHDGPAGGLAVVLLHGYPYDVRAFDDVVAILTGAGLRTIVPYLRGYGPTRFLSPDTPRSGQQAAIGQDLLDLLDALQLTKAVLAGFDWGARAACIVSAMWPQRVCGLVSCAGYQIQDIARSKQPASPVQERRFWYQYYFHTERGRDGLAQNRYKLGRLLWKLWSPTWEFDEETYRRTAASFANADFVDVVIHSYRHRMGNAAGDPRYAVLEAQLAALPKIAVPSIVLHGAVDDVNPPAGSERHASFFTGNYDRHVLKNVGHDPPQEDPRSFAQAVLDVCERG